MKNFLIKKISLLNIDEEMNGVEFQAYMKDGWSIKEMIPVLDDGQACLLVIFDKNENNIEKSNHLWIEVIKILFLLSIIILLILSINKGV